VIRVLRNEQGELAVVNSPLAFARVMSVDVIARRFRDAVTIHRIPLNVTRGGANLGLRMLIDSLGAVYPALNSERLGLVRPDGSILHGPCGKITLAGLTGTARRTIVTCMLRQIRVSTTYGYVVHL
jgi:hypothetical protein